MDRLEGGYLGAKPTWSSSTSPGVWTLSQALARRAAGTWPATSFLYDPYFESVSLLLHMNGSNGSTTFVDSSLGNLAVTANGNAQISTAQSKFGGASAYFDGTGDYLSFASQSAFGLGVGDFTIEAWIYITGGQGADRGITDFRSAGAGEAGTFFIDGILGNRLAFWYGSKLGGTGTALSLNTWYHVALTRQSGVFRCYLNGAEEWTATATVDFGSARPLGIGGAVYTGFLGSSPFFGYIDELRITRGVARYTANFAVPGAGSDEGAALYDPYFDYVSLLLRCNGENNSTTFTDSSNNALAITRNGDAKISTAWYRFGVSSAYFDGTGDYLSSSSSQLFTIGTGDFTIEAWIYPQDVSAATKIICALRLEPPSTPIHYGPSLAIEAGKLGFSNGTAWTVGGTTLTANRVYHVAVTRQNGIMNLFLNGTPDRAAWTDTSDYAGSRTMTVGAASATAYFNGYIDDLRITKGLARYTTAFRPVGPYATSGKLVDPYLASTSLLLPMTGDNGNTSFFDRSNNFLRATENGNAKVSTTQSKFGGTSAYLDGNGDYIVIPNAGSSTLNWNSGSYTIEYWIYPITLNQTAHGLPKSAAVGRMNGSNSSDWSFGPISNGTVRFAYYGTGGELGLTTTAAISTNTWSHLAFTHSGGTMTIYINGTKAATGTVSGTPSGSLTDLFIGYSYGTYLNAYIDDMRITPGVVRYGTDFTPSERAFNDEAFNDPHYNAVSLLLHMDGANNSTTFTDSSVNGLTVTANGDAKISTAQSRFGGASAVFDGTGDNLRPALSNGFEFGTGDFTIEGWLFITSSTISYPIILQIIYGSKALTFRYGDAGFGYKLQISVDAATASTVYSCSTTQSTYLNQWIHVAFTRNGGVCRLFINGIRQDLNSGANPSTYPLATFTDSTSVSSVSLVQIADSWAGYIDEFRITKGIARYTSNFTPPTLPFYNTTIPTVDSSFSSVSLLLHMNGTNGSTTFTDSSSNGLTVTANGNAQISTAQSKFGGASGAFDGTGDWLDIASTALFAFGTGDFTLEIWFRTATTITSNTIILDFRNAVSADPAQPVLYINSSQKPIAYTDGAGNMITGSTSITAGTWFHLAIVKRSGTYYLYVNGVSEGGSANNSSSVPNSKLRIGSDYTGVGSVNGYIDELRITKGVARYASNFYIPRAAFPDA